MDPVADQAIRHIHFLAGEIGPRMIGSPANHAAADYIVDQFKASGLTVERQQFDCPQWSEEFTRLEVDGEMLEAFANAYSTSCEVTAPILPLRTIPELRAADLEGKIGLLFGDLVQNRLTPISFPFASERDQLLVRTLNEKAPLAILMVNPVAGARDRMIEDHEFKIPSATVTAQVGVHLASQPGDPVHLTVSTERTAGTSCNVIARLPGKGPARIVLCAHYDTKIDTPGAHDNAAGVAVLLALAAQIHSGWKGPEIEFVAFSGEEYTLLGEDLYISSRQEHFDQILAAINIDGVGPLLSATSICGLSISPSFDRKLDDIIKKYPGVVKVDPWYESDHSIFAMRRVPALALSSIAIRDVYHTPLDDVDWVSPDRLGEAIRLVEDVLHSIEDQPVSWSRPDDGSQG